MCARRDRFPGQPTFGLSQQRPSNRHGLNARDRVVLATATSKRLALIGDRSTANSARSNVGVWSGLTWGRSMTPTAGRWSRCCRRRIAGSRSWRRGSSSSSGGWGVTRATRRRRRVRTRRAPRGGGVARIARDERRAVRAVMRVMVASCCRRRRWMSSSITDRCGVAAATCSRRASGSRRGSRRHQVE